MNKSLHKLIDEQVKRWEMSKKMDSERIDTCRVVTISRQCGSKGQEVAQKFAQAMEWDLFDHEILEAMIEASKSSKILMETLDEKGMNIIEDLVADLVHEHHLWPDQYSKLLLKVINTIGKHGNAVILGRGANCALKKINALKVRIIAPESLWRKHIQKTRDLDYEQAQNLMVSTDANRTAFVRRYFNCDALDSSNYDLIINTGTLSVDRAVTILKCALS